MKYLISKCLVGINCKYNGLNNYNKIVEEIYKNTDSILICPEVDGGLDIPRSPSEIRGNLVINKDLVDVTNNFIDGAKKALELARKNDIKKAILKDGSPSCGSSYIYDGTFSSKKIKGLGITSKMLIENGIEVISENDLKKA